MRILVLNAGSSSIKLRLLDADDAVRFSHDLDTEDMKALGALDGVADESELEAVGHRVVHGGDLFSSAVLITDDPRQAIGPPHQAWRHAGRY